MTVPIPGNKHTFEELGGALRFTIPARKQWFAIIVLPLWLIGWAVGEITVGKIVLGPLFGKPGAMCLNPFLLAWLTFWTIGGAHAIFCWLWLAAGCEVLEVDALSVRLRRQILGIGRTSDYAGEAVKELRAVAYDASWWNRSRTRNNRYTLMFEGPLNFDYGSKTIRCGNGIDEAEARQIVRTITDRYPQYGERG